MKNITTGADRLVQLIAEKKKVSLDDATKILNVNKDVIKEWAEFLEQEKHINIDYKFSKMILEEKHITKKDVINAVKEIESEKEAFERKIDAIIQGLEGDTEGFERVKLEFNKIHEHIRKEIDTVKEESKELERFNYLKNNIDKEITHQRKNYETQVKEYHDSLISHMDNFDKIKSELNKQNEKMDKVSKNIEELHSKRSEIHSTIEDGHKQLDELDKELGLRGAEFKKALKGIAEAKKQITNAQETIDQLRTKKLDKVINMVNETSKVISSKLESTEQETKDRVERIKAHAKQGSDYYQNFESVIKKNIKAEEMMDAIDKGKDQLLAELNSLKKKVKEFDFLKKHSDIKSDIIAIEKKLRDFTKKKDDLNDKVNKFFGYIKKV